MTGVSVLRSEFESTHWKRTFAETLMHLRPDMNPDAADEASDAEFVHAKEVEPATAARRWFDRQEPRSSATPAASAG